VPVILRESTCFVLKYSPDSLNLTESTTELTVLISSVELGRNGSAEGFRISIGSVTPGHGHRLFITVPFPPSFQIVLDFQTFSEKRNPVTKLRMYSKIVTVVNNSRIGGLQVI
jgi:hypothetical protein